MSWSSRFDTPIDTGTEQLTSLRDAATFITALPAKTAKLEHWHLAIKLLIDAAEHGGIVMLAAIALRQAIDHGKPAPKKPPRRKSARKFRVIR